MDTNKNGSNLEPVYDEAFFADWAMQALAHLQQLRAERNPDSRRGRKIRRALERLGQ